MKHKDRRKPELKNPVIHQRNENCQVFNGPVSDCVFNMNGAAKQQHPTEQPTDKSPHFPLTSSADKGQQLYDMLVQNNFIAPETSLDCFLYILGYSDHQPEETKPIVWLKNVQLAQEMLRGMFGPLIRKKELTISAMIELAGRCFIKDGKPLKLSKFKADPSWDSDLLGNFFRPLPTSSDLT